MANSIETEVLSIKRELDRFLASSPERVLEQSALASLTAIRMTTQRMLDHQRRLESIMRLRSVTQAFLSFDHAFDTQALLGAVAEAAHYLLSADITTVLPIEPREKRILHDEIVIVGAPKSTIRSPGNLKPQGVWNYLLNSPESLVNVENTQDRRLYPFLDDDPASFVHRMGIETYIGLRLGQQGNALGLLFINRTEPHLFNDDDLALVKLFGDFAVLVLQNRHQFELSQETIGRRAGEFKTLKSALTALPDKPDEEINRYLEQLLWLAINLTGIAETGFGFIQLVDKSRNVLQIRVSVGLEDAEKEEEFSIDPPRGATGWSAFHQKTYFSGNVRRDGDIYEDLFHRNTHSELAEPMILDGETEGIINLESPELNAFDKSHLEVVAGLASLAVVAVRELKLRKAILQARREQELVADLLPRLVSTTNLNELLETFYTYIKRLTRARDAFILVNDEDYDVLRLDTYPPGSTEIVEPSAINNMEGVSGRTFQLQQPVYESDVRGLGPKDYALFIPSTISNLGVPLTAGQRRLGVLDLESPELNAFADVSYSLVQSLGTILTSAIFSNELYQRAIYSANQLLQSGKTAHEIHTIKGIVSYALVDARAVQEQLVSIDNDASSIRIADQIEEVVGTIQASVDRLGELLNKLARDPACVTSTFGEALETAKVECGLPNDNCVLIVEADTEATTLRVRGDMEIILTNLMQNALKHGGQLKIRAQRKGAWLRVSVEDSGPGIPQENLARIFDAGFSTTGSGGIGLWLARASALAVDGSLRVESVPGCTVFTVRLPISLD